MAVFALQCSLSECSVASRWTRRPGVHAPVDIGLVTTVISTRDNLNLRTLLIDLSLSPPVLHILPGGEATALPHQCPHWLLAWCQGHFGRAQSCRWAQQTLKMVYSTSPTPTYTYLHSYSYTATHIHGSHTSPTTPHRTLAMTTAMTTTVASK